MRGPLLSTSLFAHLVLSGRRRPTGGAAGSPLPFLLGKVFCFSPPTRPASIRTLCGAVCSGASWCPQSQIGCCHLGTELSRPVSGDARSAVTSQSPELGDGLQNETTCF